MSKFTEAEYPVVGTATRPAQKIDAEALKASGLAFASYGFRKEGEVIEFANFDEITYQEQVVDPRRPNIKQVLASCFRDGKPSHFAMGSVVRRNSDNQPYPNTPFAEKMFTYENNHERMKNALAGKAIICEKMVKGTVPTFTDGYPDSTKPLREVDFPQLRYATAEEVAAANAEA